MKLKKVAFLFFGPDLDSTINRSEIKTNNFSLISVGIDINHKERAIEIAKELVANGVQMIELCGGFGPTWIAKISEALNYKVPVGGVFYGPETRQPILDLLKD